MSGMSFDTESPGLFPFQAATPEQTAQMSAAISETQAYLKNLIDKLAEFDLIEIESVTGQKVNALAMPLGIGGEPEPPTNLSPLEISLFKPPEAPAYVGTDPHVWIWLGLVGDTVPTNITSPAVFTSDGTWWIWVEATPEAVGEPTGGVMKIASSILKGSKPMPVQPPPAGPGDPPVVVNYILGRVTVIDSEISQIYRNGFGSLSFFVYSTGRFCYVDPITPGIPESRSTYSLALYRDNRG